MKIITSLIFLLSISPAYAKIYKCIENGKTSYQQTQCKQAGTEFVPAPDISIEQQEAAKKKLTTDLEVLAEQRELQREAESQERLLRAKEDNASANRQQAEETARQTEAIQNLDNNLSYQPYYYPNRPIIRPLPNRPIANSLPGQSRIKPLPNTSRAQPYQAETQ